MFRCCAAILYEFQTNVRWFQPFNHGHDSFMSQHSHKMLQPSYIMLLHKTVEKDFTCTQHRGKIVSVATRFLTARCHKHSGKSPAQADWPDAEATFTGPLAAAGPAPR